MQRMRDYFAQTSEIEFKTTFRETGDLLVRSGSAKFYIRRPNSFRVELSSAKGDYHFISDGTTLTIARPASGRYARVSASDSIIGTMYLALGLLGTEAKLVDFLWTVDYGEQLKIAARGEETIGGKACDRVTVQRFDQSWEVWLERDGPPTPLKIVTRALASNDRRTQTNDFEWTDPPAFSSELFSFTPPKDAREVSASEIE